MIAVKTKQWGNSIGIVIPKAVAEEKGIKPDEEVLVEIEKKGNPLKELFGTLKTKKTTEQILKEVRKDLESKYF
ncbi:AbrB/MazE/SpoVT family DNA-binding domain-containing protein [Candidatus Woesearchaeota archaeon]|nr:AbrB/MazE/SpoVT family DNA-binding domain-containing protein [Candidatus Woesearchaeota archaeon]